MKVDEKTWAAIVDVTTVTWMGFFLASLIVAGQGAVDLCGRAMLCLLPVLAVDLVFLYRQERNFTTLIRRRWFDVLLVIPYFRVFRIFRLFRLLKVLKLIRAKRAIDLTRFAKKGRRTASGVGRLREKDPNRSAQAT